MREICEWPDCGQWAGTDVSYSAGTGRAKTVALCDEHAHQWSEMRQDGRTSELRKMFGYVEPHRDATHTPQDEAPDGS